MPTPNKTGRKKEDMVTTKTIAANLYNDPWNPRRLTDEITIPAGTAVRDLKRTTGLPEPWSYSAQIGENGEWYRVRGYEKPV